MNKKYLCIDPTFERHWNLMTFQKLRALQARRKAEALKAGLTVATLETVKKNCPEMWNESQNELTFYIDVTDYGPKRIKKILDALMSVD